MTTDRFLGGVNSGKSIIFMSRIAFQPMGLKPVRGFISRSGLCRLQRFASPEQRSIPITPCTFFITHTGFLELTEIDNLRHRITPKG